MKRGKFILKFLSIILITIISFIPDYTFFEDNQKLNAFFRVGLVALMYMIIEIIAHYLNFKYNPFNDLISFLNLCLKKDIDICPIEKNTVLSSENNMTTNDEIHILTNDLMNYDLKQPALTLIASNIINGVNYIYYIPTSQKEDYRSFKERLCVEIIKQIATEAMDFSKEQAEKLFKLHVLFFFLPDENDLVFNFSLTLFSDPRNNIGCWYVNERDITINTESDQSQNLLIARMGSNERSYEDVRKLKSLFVKITKRYKFKLPKNSRLFM